MRWAVQRHRRDEAGIAVPMVVVGMALVTTVAIVVALLGRLLADQRRADSAADLAALAGAAAVQRGEPPCEAVAWAVTRNGARLGSCTVEGEHVRVEVVRRSASFLGRELEVAGAAHAGPVG